ncbi:MAG: sulfur carrier protein ThiS [Acidimicrobiales bacterium]|nr:sulfur carrier protein ThiS [Acidimicrobiales bacterium]
MTPLVNGQPGPEHTGQTLADVVAAWCPSPRGVAVARNGEVVPKGRWPEVVVGPDDVVEIVTAAAGG